MIALLVVPVALWAESAQDYRDAGQALSRAGQYAKALDYFKKAVQADPQDWQSYQAMGDAYNKMDDMADARDAYRKSLDINPNNSTVRVLLQNLGDETASSTPPSAPSGDNVGTDETVQSPQTTEPIRRRGRGWRRVAPVTYNDGLAPMDHAKLWAKFDLGFNYSQQGDLLSSAATQNGLITANGWTGSAVASRNGYNAGGELGFLINPNNGLAIGLRYLRNDDSTLNQNLQNGPAIVGANTYNSDFENETLSPSVWPLTLDYYLFLPDASGRFFISAGLGYYFGQVHVEDNYSYVISANDETASDTFSGDLTAGGVGFQVGLGRDWEISPRFGISLFARGRYARLTNFRGTVFGPNGGGANDGLAVYPDGEVFSTDVSNIGNNGVKYATIDFTGFDVGASLNFYSF
ncbi:MAG TPA: tetratricopeptide repeat protein [bacterium]|nr:tetratricopeptide repeat protein [bacterium]